MISMPRIFVIIVTWNGMKWIKQCLDALRQSTYPVSIVVVDNGSSDGTVDFIKDAYNEVHLIESSENLGFGQANNVGIRYALDNGCDYVYLLNQDAYVFTDMFMELINVAEKLEYKRYGVFSPLHLNRDISKLDSHFQWYMRDIIGRYAKDRTEGKLRELYDVYAVPAAGWLIARRTLETVGGFDPIFFHYGEDNHYAYRMAYHGLKFGIVPTAKMIHDRNDFGNIVMAKKDMLFRTLKTELFLNISITRKDASRRFLRSFVSFNYESLKALIRGNLFIFKEYQKAIYLNLINLPKYIRNRKQNKICGANWL